PAARPGRRPFASPLARRLAQELGVDLATVTGTGPGGAVRREDVEALAAARSTGEAVPAPPPVPAPAPSPAPGPSPAPAPAPPPAAPAVPSPPLTGADRQAAVRRAVAAAMARSNREIPHYYLTRDIDTSRSLTWLEAHNAAVGVTDRLLPVVLLLKATALALREAPDLNGTWEQDGFRPAAHVHLGVAIALRGGGLVAPALHDADRAPLPDLMARLRDVTGRARAGRLRSSEVADPTVTVTSLGDEGPDMVLPVIYPPQVAIVGLGRTRQRPWASDGMLGVRPVVTATLGADHRASDGHRGAVLLAALDHLLQDPERL
ncbi:2-oxo acid dehydrogenase subunit E2, partial [Georgenia thermotolerans]